MSYVDIIPKMTSNTAPSGVASGYLTLSPYSAYKAMNDTQVDANDCWVAWPFMSGYYLQYQKPTPALVVSGYSLTSRAAGTPRPPKSWKLQGKIEGGAWIDLDTQTNITDWASSNNVKKTFLLGSVPAAYSYFRVYITASNDASYVIIGELEILVSLPVITLIGDPIINLIIGDTYIDAGATAFDDIDGDITENIITVNPVDTDIPGTYIITYNVENSVHNWAIEVTRTVIISVIPEPYPINLKRKIIIIKSKK